MHFLLFPSFSMMMRISKVLVLHILYILLFLLCVSSQSAHQEPNATMPFRCIERERQALLMFKQGVVPASHKYFGVVPTSISSWVSEGNNTDCCEWDGVECDYLTDHVTSLELSGLKHISINTTSSLVELKSLQSLELAFNDFGNMPIPNFICSLTSLKHLKLTHSNLSEPIPYQLKNLSNLESLDLSGNEFGSNTIPEFISSFTNLKILNLADSNFNGTIPYQLRNLSKLETLQLSGNKDLFMNDSKWLSCLSSLTYLDLSGIDLSRANGLHLDDLIKALPLLYLLVLSNCNLRGVMAPSLSSPNSSSSSSSQLFISSDKLTYLYLSNNNLTGTLPAFRDCPSLQLLFLSNNQFSVFLPETFGHVPNLKFLFISRNSLEVVINKEHLSNLSGLLYLDLSFNNNISFNLSPQHVSHLHLNFLYLRSCMLGPQFPNWIKTQQDLLNLDLSENEISDSIPAWIWNTTMIYLNLSFNRITGTLQAPTPVNLSFLDVSNNHLSGEIPDCWMNFENLQILKLAHNNFSGKVPNSLGFLMRLEVLDLESNKLSGELPMLLKNCTSLKFLNLRENEFSGSIPAWLGGISNLSFLIMRSNKFMGSIPLQLCQLGKLQLLDLSRNNISGKLPTCFNNFTGMVHRSESLFTEPEPDPNTAFSLRYSYHDSAVVMWKGMEREFGKNLEYMRNIDLSSNKLNGELPKTIFDLAELVALNLSNNYLRGNIASEIGNLKLLDSLDLSNNRFSGGIPATMSQLTSLGYLNLSSNNLSGKIPEVTQLQGFNASAYAGNDALCGAPLEQKCAGNEQPSQVPLISTNDDEETDEFDGWFYVAAALGFSTTFWGVCGALFLNRRWRHAYYLYLYNLKDWVYVVVNVFIAKIRRT